jgi:hypothetical protein
MSKNAQKIALAAGLVLGIILLGVVVTTTILKYGFVYVTLLLSFLALAVQDARTGKVNIFVLVLPVALVGVFYLDVFLKVFLGPFAVLAAIWAGIHYVQDRVIFEKQLPFGFADVVAIPLAMALSNILAGFWGLVIFGAATALVILPAMLKRKTLRLVPWLLPGVLAAFALGFFL